MKKEAVHMTREELDKKIEATLAENRAVLERSEAHSRWFAREAPLRAASTERAFRELRESIRRR
jgi:hypothetical protein